MLAGALAGEPTDAQREIVRAATPLVQERMQVLAEAPDMLGFLLVADERPAWSPEDARKALDRRRRRRRWPRPQDALLGSGGLGARPTSRPRCAPALVDGLGLKPRLAFTPAAGRGHRAARSRRRCSSRWSCSAAASTLARIAALRDQLP